VERAETGEANRVEPTPSRRSSDAAEHIVTADHVGDSMPTDQSDRRLAVELCEAHDMRTAGDRGHRRDIAERAAEWERSEQHRIRRIQSNTVGDVGGMPRNGLLIVQDQFRPTGGARG
jgi:hypothetical protein